MSKQFDVLVIGAGPGGYIAAIRAGQLGLNVACCEGNPYDDPKGEARLGGTCLNVGCIPSKALLASSEEFENVQHHLGDHGITVGDVKVDVAKMLKRKDDIVGKMTKGIEFLFRKNKVTLLKGYGKFVGKTAEGFQVDIAGEVVTAKQVIIATGSKARHLPGIAVDNDLVSDNEGALKFPTVPKKLGVIGAGVIGLELGSVWRRLGADVTVLEALPAFLGACDEGVAKEAQKQLTKQGLKFSLGVKVDEVTTGKNGVTVKYTDKDGKAQTLEVDRLIVSVGRVPNTDNLGLDAVGLAAGRPARLHRGGRPLRHQGAGPVGHRRRGARPDAGAQGRGRRRGRGRAHRRPEAAHRLQLRSVGDLHLPGNRMGRQDRSPAQGRRPRVQGRPVPVHGQRPCAGHGPCRRLRQDAGRRQDRRDPGRAHRCRQRL